VHATTPCSARALAQTRPTVMHLSSIEFIHASWLLLSGFVCFGFLVGQFDICCIEELTLGDFRAGGGLDLEPLLGRWACQNDWSTRFWFWAEICGVGIVLPWIGGCVRVHV